MGGTVSLREHLDALRAADAELAAERDRRYAEVSAEQGKALRIKETADEKALDLASQIQTYKDQQHNGLLQQLTEERGRYATQSDLKSVTEKLELAVKPLAEYVAAQQGRTGGEADTRTERRASTGQLIQWLLLGAAIATVIVYVLLRK